MIRGLKELIVQLDIKGSFHASRKDGLIEFRSRDFGSVYGKDDKECKLKIIQKLADLQKQSTAIPKVKQKKKPTTPLFSSFYTTKYLPYKVNEDRVAENTIEGYKNCLKCVTESKFDLPLGEYTSLNVEAFLLSIPTTRKRQIVQGFMNNLFKYAKRLLIIRDNPCEPIDKMKHKQKEGTTLSFAEQIVFFTNLLNDEVASYVIKCYFTFVYLTGTRRNEALGLTVDDVDFKNKTLRI
jgi:integrase